MPRPTATLRFELIVNRSVLFTARYVSDLEKLIEHYDSLGMTVKVRDCTTNITYDAANTDIDALHDSIYNGKDKEMRA